MIALRRVYNLLRAFYIRIIEIWISNLSLSCVIYLELNKNALLNIEMESNALNKY